MLQDYMKYFDAHCQLQFPQFDPDRAEVLARMRALGVGSIVIGTDFTMSKAGLELANRHDFLWASVGLHPNETEVFDAAQYEELARDQKVVAIGECGLDYFRSDKTGQKEKFEQQISLAVKLGKPLIIHCRDAHEDMLAILAERRPNVPVIMHFFTATGELAQKYLDLGCYLSFPGPITYTTMYDESIRVTPLDKILSETDSPFAAPVPNRGKRNEPAFVTDVVAKIAAVKGLPSDEMASLTVKNAYTVFGLPAGMESLQN